MSKKLIYLISFVLLLGLAGNASAGNIASNPSPPDGATCVDPNVVLGWAPGDYATEHHVYFGLDPAALALVAIKPVGQESYAHGLLELGTTYYWQINESNGTDVWVGDVWSFTVGYPFWGLLHTPLGQAQLSSDANGNLVVSNIGSSGQDGVKINLQEAYNSWYCLMENYDESNSVPNGARLEITSTVNPDGGPVQCVTKFGNIKEDNHWQAFIDLQAMCRCYRVDGFLDGERVYTQQFCSGEQQQEWVYIIVKIMTTILDFLDYQIITTTTTEYDEYGNILSIKTTTTRGWSWIGSAIANIGGGPSDIELDRLTVTTVSYQEPDVTFTGFLDVSVTAKDIPSLTIVDELAEITGCPRNIPGDVNGDCYVNFFDVAILAGNWLECYKPGDPNCTWEP